MTNDKSYREELTNKMISETSAGRQAARKCLMLADWHYKKALEIFAMGIEEYLLSKVAQLEERIDGLESRIRWLE